MRLTTASVSASRMPRVRGRPRWPPRCVAAAAAGAGADGGGDAVERVSRPVLVERRGRVETDDEVEPASPEQVEPAPRQQVEVRGRVDAAVDVADAADLDRPVEAGDRARR